MMYQFNRRSHFLWVRQNLSSGCAVGAKGRVPKAILPPMSPQTSVFGSNMPKFSPFSTSAKKGGEYHGLKTSDKFVKKAWVDQPEDYNEVRLDIDGHPVMQAWEANYMAELARIATSKGGRVLEVGFGMAISATAVQQFPIKEHIIMEANAGVFKRLQAFAVKYPNVTPMGPALWQDSISKIADASIDGILYDTYPLNKEEQHIHQFEFLKEARRILKPGGILTYCNLTSLGILKNNYDSWEVLFEETQRPHLLKAGFTADEFVGMDIVPVKPTADCEYYSHDTAMAPKIIRRGYHTSARAFGSGKRNFSSVRQFGSASSSAMATNQDSIESVPRLNGKHSAAKKVTNANTARVPKEQYLQKKVHQHTILGATGKNSTAAMYPQVGTMAAELPAVATQPIKVNAWSQWGDLDCILVGHANFACFPPTAPGFRPELNDPEIAKWLPWPEGRKNKASTDAANRELDNLSSVLQEEGIKVIRPDSMDWKADFKTPFFEAPNQYCSTCARDSLITIGNIVMEASMSRRDRYFEALSFRSVIRHLWDNDEKMLWKSAPKPMLGEDSFDDSWWDQSTEERHAKMHDYKFCITEKDVLFDAADIMRAGKDIFVQLSMTCNQSGISWLKRELAPHGIRVHTIKFPYDLAPSHLDCTFQLLRPGLVLTNPERPIATEDAGIFKRNGWEFVDAPQPNVTERPLFSQSSKWLSMNILPLGRNKIVVEEQEVSTQGLLRSLGFQVIAVPFRNVYEFGGSLHCATWDISRTDTLEDYFPNQ